MSHPSWNDVFRHESGRAHSTPVVRLLNGLLPIAAGAPRAKPALESHIAEALAPYGFIKKAGGQYSEGEVVCFLWLLFARAIDGVIASGYSGELTPIADNHWAKDFSKVVVRLVSPYLEKSGESGILDDLGPTSECAEYLRANFLLLLGVDIKCALLDEALSFVVPHSFTSSRFIALTVLQCQFLANFLGESLHQDRTGATAWV